MANRLRNERLEIKLTKKVTRKNTRQAESLGMKMNNQRKVLLGKAGFNLTLTA